MIFKFVLLFTLLSLTYARLSSDVYTASKGRLHPLNEIYFKKGFYINSLAAIEFDEKGSPFIWLSDGGEIISVFKNTIDSDIELLITIDSNPCGFTPNLQLEFDAKKFYNYNDEVVSIRILKENSQILITPIFDKTYQDCFINGLDKRNFLAKLEFAQL
jgi:hypothetical protein